MNQGVFPMVNVNAHDHAFTYTEKVKATSQKQTRHRRLTAFVSSITKVHLNPYAHSAHSKKISAYNFLPLPR